MDNDIALLLLDSYIVFSDLKEPICMPRQSSPATWTQCWVAGWGQTKPGDLNSVTTELMKVPMIIMDWERCSKVFPKLTKNMLCASYKNMSYDSCQPNILQVHPRCHKGPWPGGSFGWSIISFTKRVTVGGL
uniref:Serine protease 55 n=1 Tax=Molossus molossus TaxID=27622 RepID=A0A7J8IBH1_MOLMO|nr:serine protease 55 [Molossus molossus]